MAEDERAGRSNQKKRTRKHLLDAAARLMKQGRKPRLEEIAEEALVSRATAYRYFPDVEALLVEASLDLAVPPAEEVLNGASAHDPVERLERVDDTLHDMILANGPALRVMLARSLERQVEPDGENRIPARQNRRTPLIRAALEPVLGQLDPESADRLSSALALVIGTEAMIVFQDVLQLDDDEARAVKRWTIRALVEAAKREGAPAKRKAPAARRKDAR